MIHEDDYEAMLEVIEEFCLSYQKLDIPVIEVSATNEHNLDAVKDIMKGKTSVFSGQSGVGKTSLINAMLGLDLRIDDVKYKTQKGKHTTTSANLMPLDFGGYCIDTPGIKSFGLWDIQLSELLDFFPDIAAFSHECKYTGCLHIHEPYCGVKDAVESGALSAQRYSSYLALYDDLKEQRSLF
jgi:ribosome biogenesis GTPase